LGNERGRTKTNFRKGVLKEKEKKTLEKGVRRERTVVEGFHTQGKAV